MTVESCKLVRSTSGEIPADGKYKATLHYKVKMKNVVLDPFSVVAETQSQEGLSVRIPKRFTRPVINGNTLPTFVLNVKLQLVASSHHLWDVTVQCGSLPEGREENEQNPDDPLKRAVQFWLEFQSVQAIDESDKDGKPIVNSAGDAYDTPLVGDDYAPVIVAEKNYADWLEVLDLAKDYRRTVSKDKFFDYEPGEVKWLAPNCSRVKYEAGIKHYTAELRFAVSPYGDWKTRLVDRGYNELVGGKLREIRRDGVPLSRPALLDGAGLLLAQGQLGKENEHEILTPKDYKDLA